MITRNVHIFSRCWVQTCISFDTFPCVGTLTPECFYLHEFLWFSEYFYFFQRTRKSCIIRNRMKITFAREGDGVQAAFSVVLANNCVSIPQTFDSLLEQHLNMQWCTDVLTRLLLHKMAAISQMAFSKAFSWMKVLYFSYFTEACSWGYNWQ